MAHIQRATIDDAIDLALRLRPEDVAEIAAGSGECPVVSLVRSYLASDAPKAIIHDGQVIGLFGVTPLGGGVGAPWMLASPELPQIAVAFLKGAREVVAGWRSEYKLLMNTVDARNTTHIRWLQWLGFSFIRLIPEHGAGRLPFYEFVLIGDHNV